jgi:hypothetical protein
MDLYAAVSRKRQGELMGGDGQRFREDAERWITENGIVNPDAMADVLAPGRWR